MLRELRRGGSARGLRDGKSIKIRPAEASATCLCRRIKDVGGEKLWPARTWNRKERYGEERRDGVRWKGEMRQRTKENATKKKICWWGTMTIDKAGPQ
jgi:hypothetical protein